MNMWGGKMTDALFTLAEMAAVGFEMPSKDAFTSRMLFGPHLLAPTGIIVLLYPILQPPDKTTVLLQAQT